MSKQATIKKQKYLHLGEWYYQVMIKKDGFFSTWKEEFCSTLKSKADEVFNDIARCPNIRVRW